jgi:hypothetical protein
MKAAMNSQAPVYWASIKTGKFEVYHNGQKFTAGRIAGRIVGQYMKDDAYEGRKFRICLFHTEYDGERTIIAVRTDSGYFRTLANYLTSANAQGRAGETFIFSPSYKEENGRKIAAMFLQDAELKVWYKAFHTKETQTLPQPKKVSINGADVWDWSDIVQYYERFIIATYSQGWPETISAAASITVIADYNQAPVIINDADDLPF